MSSISNQLSGYGGIPSGCGSSINGRKLPEGTSSNGAGASSTSPSGNSSSSFNSHSNLHSNSHLNSSSPSSYHHSSYYAASAAAASPAELAMYGHLNAFTSHRSHSHHHSSSLNKPKAKARSNAGKTKYLFHFLGEENHFFVAKKQSTRKKCNFQQKQFSLTWIAFKKQIKWFFFISEEIIFIHMKSKAT